MKLQDLTDFYFFYLQLPQIPSMNYVQINRVTCDRINQRKTYAFILLGFLYIKNASSSTKI